MSLDNSLESKKARLDAFLQKFNPQQAGKWNRHIPPEKFTECQYPGCKTVHGQGGWDVNINSMERYTIGDEHFRYINPNPVVKNNDSGKKDYSKHVEIKKK